MIETIEMRRKYAMKLESSSANGPVFIVSWAEKEQYWWNKFSQEIAKNIENTNRNATLS